MCEIVVCHVFYIVFCGLQKTVRDLIWETFDGFDSGRIDDIPIGYFHLTYGRLKSQPYSTCRDMSFLCYGFPKNKIPYNVNRHERRAMNRKIIIIIIIISEQSF